MNLPLFPYLKLDVMRNWILITLTLLLGKLPSAAQVTLPSIFSDNMVLQQKSTVQIWGTASGDNQVKLTTSWNKRSYKATAGPDGKWRLLIETPLAGGPFTLTIQQKNKIVLNNILIGEVWLCSGQSNMDMPVKGYLNSPVLGANDLLMNARNPQIRLFRIGKHTSAVPVSDVKGNWTEADISSVNEFSAVGYQFAKYLQNHLGVPIGIIQSTWGGSPIEAWMDKAALDEGLITGLAGNKAISKAVHQTPSNLFNGMIAPIVGFGIKGVLWYQGEQNRHNYASYSTLQPAMVNSWRKHWGMGNWPFYYVQIAPMHYAESQSSMIPRLREVQLQAMDIIPQSGMVVSIDAGQERNIHPADKTIISKRLVYWALANVYQKSGIAFRGPEYESMKISADTVELQFKNAPFGLSTFGKKLTQFELSGADRKFYPADAMIKGRKVIVISKYVKEPVALRYAFKDWAVGELYNTAGIPVSSFRTDNW